MRDTFYPRGFVTQQLRTFDGGLVTFNTEKLEKLIQTHSNIFLLDFILCSFNFSLVISSLTLINYYVCRRAAMSNLCNDMNNCGGFLSLTPSSRPQPRSSPPPPPPTPAPGHSHAFATQLSS